MHPARYYFDRVEGISAKAFGRRTLMTLCQQTADLSVGSANQTPKHGFVQPRTYTESNRSLASRSYVGSAASVSDHSLFSPPHKDAITDMKVISNEEHSLLLSSGRDGVVNVWKADFLSAWRTK